LDQWSIQLWQYTDLMVFRLGLKQKLLAAGEMAQADGIYACESKTIIAPNESMVQLFSDLKTTSMLVMK